MPSTCPITGVLLGDNVYVSTSSLMTTSKTNRSCNTTYYPVGTSEIDLIEDMLEGTVKMQLWSHICDHKSHIATPVTLLWLAVTICVWVTLLQFSHISATTLVTTFVPTPLDNSCIYRSPQKEEWVIPFLFHADSDLLSLDSFQLPLPSTSSLSPFPFPPPPLQHQQGLATLVA